MSIYQPILNQIRTRDEADQLKDEIEILLKSLFQSHKSFEEALKTTVRKNTKEAITSCIIERDSSVIARTSSVIARNGVTKQSQKKDEIAAPRSAGLAMTRGGRNDDKSQLKEFLNGLKEELQKLRVLKVTLVFYPTEKTIDKLFSWVSTNIGKGIILEIEEDQSIMGGAVIEYMGKYLNASLKKKMEEVFEKRREEIIGLIAQ